MGDNYEYVEYRELFSEYLQELFPDQAIVSSSFRASIEDGRLQLPEAHVLFEEPVFRAEQTIRSNIKDFIQPIAREHRATYTKTLIRIIVEDLQSNEQDLQDWNGSSDWY